MEINKEISLQEREDAIAKKEGFIQAMSNNFWGHSVVGVEAKKAAMAMLSTKTGLFAKVPIVCKQSDCPYAATCGLLEYDLAPLGEKCPVETAMIETRWNYYMEDYNLDEASFTDQTLVAELINIDVMLERCEAISSKEQLPITDVVAGMTESGEEYTRPEVSKAYELYERCLNRKDKILDNMLGTRRSQKGQQGNSLSVNEMLDNAINTEFIVEERPDNL